MTEKNKIDKKIVLGVLDRALQKGLDSEVIFEEPEFRRKEVFRGLAEDWKEFWKEDFQRFAAEHNILPETKIAIADLGRGKFVVIALESNRYR